MNLIQKQISKKLLINELRFQQFFIILIFLGIPLNLYKNSSYDNSWTIGEWQNLTLGDLLEEVYKVN